MIQTVVEILIDKSGSMGYMKGAGPEHENKYLIDGLTRMSLIKKILIEQIVPTLKHADHIKLELLDMKVVKSTIKL